MLISELERYCQVDFVNFGQSQASCFHISSLYAKYMNWLLAPASYLPNQDMIFGVDTLISP